MVVRIGIFAAALGCALLAAARAHAGPFDDPYDVPDAPRPPTLPELTHPDLEATLESTIGSLTPRAGATPSTTCDVCAQRVAYVQRIGVEIPVGLRRWFVGANYEFAAGGEAGNTVHVIGGNLELYGRTVWATATGMAFGGGIGLLAPVAQVDVASEAGSVARSAATLRPWDVSFFTPHAFGFHPFIDVRDIVGPISIQFREGLDILADQHDITSRRIAAITGLYVGYRPISILGVGVEMLETYTIDSPLNDDRLRATFVVIPSVRVMTPYLQPALSGFTNVGPPLDGNADRIWGFRIAITVVYDPKTKEIEPIGPHHGAGQ